MLDEGYTYFRPWQLAHVHWNAFVAAYKHSPFFDYYADEFHRFLSRSMRLFDFNLELCEWVCQQIDMQPRLIPTDDYVEESETADDSGNGFILNGIFGRRTRSLCRNLIIKYLTKTRFLPNLSVIDLLFNMGPESLLVLRDSIGSFNEF